MSKGSYIVNTYTRKDTSYRSFIRALVFFFIICLIILLASIDWSAQKSEPDEGNEQSIKRENRTENLDNRGMKSNKTNDKIVSSSEFTTRDKVTTKITSAPTTPLSTEFKKTSTTQRVNSTLTTSLRHDNRNYLKNATDSTSTTLAANNRQMVSEDRASDSTVTVVPTRSTKEGTKKFTESKVTTLHTTTNPSTKVYETTTEIENTDLGNTVRSTSSEWKTLQRLVGDSSDQTTGSAIFVASTKNTGNFSGIATYSTSTTLAANNSQMVSEDRASDSTVTVVPTRSTREGTKKFTESKVTTLHTTTNPSTKVYETTTESENTDLGNTIRSTSSERKTFKGPMGDSSDQTTSSAIFVASTKNTGNFSGIVTDSTSTTLSANNRQMVSENRASNSTITVVPTRSTKESTKKFTESKVTTLHTTTNPSTKVYETTTESESTDLGNTKRSISSEWKTYQGLVGDSSDQTTSSAIFVASAKNTGNFSGLGYLIHTYSTITTTNPTTTQSSQGVAADGSDRITNYILSVTSTNNNSNFSKTATELTAEVAATTERQTSNHTEPYKSKMISSLLPHSSTYSTTTTTIPTTSKSSQEAATDGSDLTRNYTFSVNSTNSNFSGTETDSTLTETKLTTKVVTTIERQTSNYTELSKSITKLVLLPHSSTYLTTTTTNPTTSKISREVAADDLDQTTSSTTLSVTSTNNSNFNKTETDSTLTETELSTKVVTTTERQTSNYTELPKSITKLVLLPHTSTYSTTTTTNPTTTQSSQGVVADASDRITNYILSVTSTNNSNFGKTATELTTEVAATTERQTRNHTEPSKSKMISSLLPHSSTYSTTTTTNPTTSKSSQEVAADDLDQTTSSTLSVTSTYNSNFNKTETDSTLTETELTTKDVTTTESQTSNYTELPKSITKLVFLPHSSIYSTATTTNPTTSKSSQEVAADDLDQTTSSTLSVTSTNNSNFNKTETDSTLTERELTTKVAATTEDIQITDQ